MAIILHPHICQRTFYDRLDLSKGPSLGTDFTLVCPYTLLAHYHELDFAMSYQVQPNLIRIAVGLEDLEVLEERFETVLEESVLHKNLPLEGGSTRGVATAVGAARGYCTSRGSAGGPCFGVQSTWQLSGLKSRSSIRVLSPLPIGTISIRPIRVTYILPQRISPQSNMILI